MNNAVDNGKLEDSSASNMKSSIAGQNEEENNNRASENNNEVKQLNDSKENENVIVKENKEETKSDDLIEESSSTQNIDTNKVPQTKPVRPITPNPILKSQRNNNNNNNNNNRNNADEVRFNLTEAELNNVEKADNNIDLSLLNPTNSFGSLSPSYEHFDEDDYANPVIPTTDIDIVSSQTEKSSSIDINEIM